MEVAAGRATPMPTSREVDGRLVEHWIPIAITNLARQRERRILRQRNNGQSICETSDDCIGDLRNDDWLLATKTRRGKSYDRSTVLLRPHRDRVDQLQDSSIVHGEICYSVLWNRIP